MVLLLLLCSLFNVGLRAVEGQTDMSSFPDVSTNDWYYRQAKMLVEHPYGIIQGTSDNGVLTFSGQKTLTGEQFIAMILRAVGEGNTVRATNTGEGWATPYIERAKELELISDIDKDYSKDINREEMSQMIITALEFLNTKNGGDAIVYDQEMIDKVDDYASDYNSIGGQYLDAVEKTYVSGIITGYPDGSFGPQRVLTRAEASVVVVRMLYENERQTLADRILLEAGDYTDYYRGGSKWQDPLAMGTVNNIYYRNDIIGADNFAFTVRPIDDEGTGHYGISDFFIDEMRDGLKISMAYDGNMETAFSQLGFLLGRRLESNELSIIMDYLTKKDDVNSTIYENKSFTATNSTGEERENYREAFFFGRYVVTVYETQYGGMLGIPFSYSGITMTIMSRGDTYTGTGTTKIFNELTTYSIIYQTAYVN